MDTRFALTRRLATAVALTLVLAGCAATTSSVRLQSVPTLDEPITCAGLSASRITRSAWTEPCRPDLIVEDMLRRQR